MNELRDLFDNDVRHIKSKFEVFIDGKDAPPLVLTDDNLVIDSSILEEAGTDSQMPLGNISSNELVITLHNENKDFSLNNTKSPYYGKLIPGIKVKAYHCIADTNGSYIDVNMGTYYTTSWRSDTGSITASVTCNDRMYILGDVTLPKLLPDSNISVCQVLSKVLNSVGMKPNEYDIQLQNETRLRAFSYPTCKLKEFLQLFVTGYGCLIYFNRDDKLIIKDVLFTPETPIASFTDDNQILSLTVPQEVLSLYTSVDLSYNHPQVSDRKVLLDMRGVSLSEGLNKLDNISFNASPVVRLDSVAVDGGAQVDIQEVNYNSWNISLTLNKSKTTLSNDTYCISATGYIIENTSQKLSVTDSDLQKLIGERTLEIKSGVIQEQSEAIAYSNKMLRIITKIDAYLELSCRGNSTICVGDSINIQDATNTISGNYIVYRSKLDHNGALQATMKLIKVVSE